MLSASTLPSNRLIMSSNYWSWLPLLQIGTTWSKADQNLSSVLDHLIKNQGLHEPKRLKFRSPATHWLIKTSEVCSLCHRPLLNFWNKSRKKRTVQSNAFICNYLLYSAPSQSKIQIQNVHTYFGGKYCFSSLPHSLWCVRWWLFKRWEIRWRVTRRCIRGPHIAGRWWQGLGVVREARRSGGWKHAGMLKVISRVGRQVRSAVVVGVVRCHLWPGVVGHWRVCIFNCAVQCREGRSHVFKASKYCCCNDP